MLLVPLQAEPVPGWGPALAPLGISYHHCPHACGAHVSRANLWLGSCLSPARRIISFYQRPHAHASGALGSRANIWLGSSLSPARHFVNVLTLLVPLEAEPESGWGLALTPLGTSSSPSCTW